MIDILCGVLSGANWGLSSPFPHHLKAPERSVGKGLGYLFGAFRIDGFIEVDEFKKRVDEWVRVFRGTKPALGTNGPHIPGDPERAAEAARRAGGIRLTACVMADLRYVSAQSGIAFDYKL